MSDKFETNPFAKKYKAKNAAKKEALKRAKHGEHGRKHSTMKILNRINDRD